MEENNTPSGKSILAFLNPLPVILGLVGLIPFFGLPFFNLPIATDKGVFFVVCVIVALMFWLIARLVDGTFVFPRTKILLVAGLLVVSLFLSTIFSGAITPSFFGSGGGDTSSFFYTLLFFVLMFLSAISFQTVRHFFNFFLAVLGAFFVLFVLQAAHFLGAFDSLGILQATFIARWNDLAIFFGLIIVFGLVLLELFPFTRALRWLTGTSVVLALLGGAVLNFRLFWWSLAISSVLIFLYGFLYRRKARADMGDGVTGSHEMNTKKGMSFLRPALLVFVVSVLALIFVGPGKSLDQKLNDKLPAPVEARPSIMGTFDVVKDSLAGDPLLGVGPNRFFVEWVKTRPAPVNDGPFWNMDFNNGVGRIPTYLVTGGLLGTLLWVIFLGFLLYYGVRTLFAPIEKPLHALVVAVFAGMAYLWAINIVYVPELVLMVLTFVITGVFIALLVRTRFVQNITFNLASEPGRGFGAVIALILLLILSFAGGYIGLKKYIALAYAQKGLLEYGAAGNVDVLGLHLSKAAQLDSWDFYYRSLSDAYLLRMQRDLSVPNLSDEEIQNRFVNAYTGVLNNAFKATEIDPGNYVNWLTLGNVYETVALPPFGIKGAYEEAKKRYERARELNPTSPIIPFRLARLEAGVGNYDNALALLAESLKIKSNYTPALFLGSQIEVQRGNLDKAIEKAEQAFLVSPNDIGVLFQLGFLRYRNEEYRKSIAALERAVTLNPQYSNARYFLALSYERIGQRSAAIKQFEQVLALNPGNSDVENIIANLRAGRSPFAGVPAPDNSPETSKKPPIEEAE